MPDEQKPSNSNRQPTKSNGEKPTIMPPRPTEKPGFMVIREMTDKKREAEKKSVQNGQR